MSERLVPALWAGGSLLFAIYIFRRQPFRLPSGTVAAWLDRQIIVSGRRIDNWSATASNINCPIWRSVNCARRSSSMPAAHSVPTSRSKSFSEFASLRCISIRPQTVKSSSGSCPNGVSCDLYKARGGNVRRMGWGYQRSLRKTRRL